jgi:hypothetical protein
MNMNQEQLIAQLKDYYGQHHIGAVGFLCTHRSQCSCGYPKFVEATEPLIGTEYGIGIPRLVVLSLDPGGADQDPNQRIIERRNNWKAGGWRPTGREKSQHWYRTLETVHTILSHIDKSIACIVAEDVIPYFAHVNSGRCCQNKDKHASADALLFDNCRGFIPQEIEILSPDVLITQGDYAKRAIDEGINEGKFRVLQTCELVSSLGTRTHYSKVNIENHDALWLHTYHPNQKRGLFQKQRKEFILPIDQYPRIVQEFWVQRNGHC